MNEQSALKKNRLNKKTDKSNKLAEKYSSCIENIDDLNYKEPYQCTGKFSDDFQALCKQNQIFFIPPILLRPKRPTSPLINEQKFEKPKLNKKSENFLSGPSNTQMGVSTENIQKPHNTPDLDEKDNETDIPKTYISGKDKYEYFKPKIHVEMESSDKLETVTEIYVRGWKIDMQIMNILQECLLFIERLTTINLWNCGLSESIVESLSKIAPKCVNLKSVILDGNTPQNPCFHKLIDHHSILQNLSLRNCNINDDAVALIGTALGNLRCQNNKLVSLNLSNNYIENAGAIALAQSLRTNRTLLNLNLSGNLIGDIGAFKFSESLSRFQLTHDEIVHRRMIQIGKLNKLNELNPFNVLFQKKKDKIDTSERPASHIFNKEKMIKEKEKTLKKEKSDINLSNTSNRERSRSKETTIISKDLRENSNDKSIGNLKNKKETTAESKQNHVGAVKKGIITNEKNSKTLKLKDKSKKFRDQDLTEVSETSSLKSASGTRNSVLSTTTHAAENQVFIDDVESINGELWMSGNRNLISLNLSRNQLTNKSLYEFILCLQYQQTLYVTNKNTNLGLLRLNIKNNLFPLDHEMYNKLMILLKAKDPILNKPVELPIENVTLATKDSKESKIKSGTNKH